jgi:hypothetical protein
LIASSNCWELFPFSKSRRYFMLLKLFRDLLTMNTTSLLPSLQDYITELLPGAHGHQIKAITAYVSAIIDKQTGTQAELARSFGNQPLPT